MRIEFVLAFKLDNHTALPATRVLCLYRQKVKVNECPNQRHDL
jgi:hypothetical protein